MRIVVTGATSFIGLAVVKELLGQGHEVFAVVRPESPGRKKLESEDWYGGKRAGGKAAGGKCTGRKCAEGSAAGGTVIGGNRGRRACTASPLVLPS